MKRLSAILLALVVLISMSSALADSAGSSSNPLITLSYLESNIIPNMTNAVDKIVQSYIYDNGYDAELERLYNAALSRVVPDGYTLAASYVAVEAPTGGTVSLTTGGSIILVSGAMRLNTTSGQVINLNTATPGTGNLEINVRYFATEDTTVIYTASESSVCLVSGPYRLADGAVIMDLKYFNDLDENSKYFEAAHELCERGIMTQVSGSSFEPKTDITIESLIGSMWRLAGSPGRSAKEWAQNVGIWSYSQPDTIVTHEQLAYILYRYAGTVGLNTDSSINLREYEDYNKVTPEYRLAVAWAFEHGILTGSLDTVLEPLDHTTRVQTATSIYTLLEMIEE